MKVRKWKCQSLSRVRLFETPWTSAHQAPLSMEFSRQQYWSDLPFPFKKSSQPRDRTCVSYIGRWIFYHWATWEAQESNKLTLKKFLRLLTKNSQILHFIIHSLPLYLLKHIICFPEKKNIFFFQKTSIHLCLVCCLTYRVIVTIFLNSIYMHYYTILVFFFLPYFTLHPPH